VATLRETHERELKLTVPAGFALPDLPGEPLGPKTLTSTYHDTADRALARAGITLRRRVENRRGLWQLKLPGEGERLELEVPGPPAGPPDELASLLTGILRGRALEPAAVLRTRRAGVRVQENGRAVADVTVDNVAVLDGRRVRERFVELEVEALDGGADSLPGLGRVLAAAGAVPGDGRPKAFRAMGFFPVTPAVPPSWAPSLEHVRAMIARQVAELLAHDPGTRLGKDPEELHQARVATRRLRAVLRAARPLLDPAWTESLRAELSGLGGALGPVRDLDVLLERLRGEIEQLEGPERRAAGRFLELLGEERDEARVVDDQRGSPTYVGHLAAATREVLELPQGVWHVAADGEATWAEFAVAIFEEAEVDCRVVPISTEELGRPAPRPAYSVLRSGRQDAPQLPHWREGLRECLARLGA